MSQAFVFEGDHFTTADLDGALGAAGVDGADLEGWWDGTTVRPVAVAAATPEIAAPLPTVRTEAFLTTQNVEASSSGITYTATPVTREDTPLFGGPSGTWDQEISFVSVTKRDGLWHAHYYGLDLAPTDFTCYAYSTDGVTFTRPNIGWVTYNGSTDNNIVQPGIFTSSTYDEEMGAWVLVREANLRVYTSPTPEGPFAEQKNLNVAGVYIEGKEVVRLPDGRWAGYYSHGHTPQRRTLGVFTSDSSSLGGGWTHLGDVAAFTATNQDHQFYGIGVERIGDAYAGFVMIYNKTDETIWIDLYSSQDALTWTLVQANWMPLGTAGGWDDAMLINGSTLVENGDQWEFFYTGSPLGHAVFPRDMRIGKATLRRGGIMQAAGPGTITTTAVNPQTGTLTVNADGSGGAVTVEVLDASGNALIGYGATLTTDNTAHSVAVPARPARLRFTLAAGAKLYGYTVT